MHQVLFNIPVFKEWFPPDGIPVYGFGAMLFITFVVCTFWGVRRARAVGMSPERFQDLTIWLFISGLVGARVLYMIQYSKDFPDKDIGALVVAFFQIWKGGIIFYGSALGGVLGYGLFYWYVLRRLKVSGWQLADAVAPLLALGLAIGRIGCYLNGCCWGQVAVPEACPVPLGGAQFPILPGPARDQMVRAQGLQTSTGFTTDRPAVPSRGADPRTVVRAVEPGSAAAEAGLRPGDRITEVNGQVNVLVEVFGTGEKAERVVDKLRELGAHVEPGTAERNTRAFFDTYEAYAQTVDAVHRAFPDPDFGVSLSETDLLGELVRDWPRGRNAITLTVQRDGRAVKLAPFVPRTVGFYPTQLYETVSMVLLIFLLLAYYPFRRHDGELMVLCMLGYAVHRFVNESLRIEPTVGLGLTLSQWGSVVIFAAGVGIEAYLWRVMPSRWRASPVGAPVAPPQASPLPQPAPAAAAKP